MLHLLAKQPGKAEMDKMMKEAKDMLKQYGGDSLADKKLAELEKNEKQFKNIVSNSQVAIKNTDVTSAKFPAKQIKLLYAVSKKNNDRAFVPEKNFV